MKRLWIKTVILCFIIVFSHSKELNVLLLGGNGFMGSECAHSLLAQGHKVTVLNRGTNYYDYDTRIKPFVTVMECDRYEGLQNCLPLNRQHHRFDVIIDFSAYEPTILNDALEYFEERFGVYIYISSDSVYEVSVGSNNRKSVESDAVRPQSEEEQKRLRELDSYGHFKLQGEELIHTRNQMKRFRYVILRLPDVIGPRDTTHRWWTYQTRLQFFSVLKKPIPLPRVTQSLATSYVYVKDVARLLTEIAVDVSMGTRQSENQTLNFAFPGAMSLKTLLYTIQTSLGVQGVEYNYDDSPNIMWFPSVTRGPIDVTKIEYILEFKTTPWTEAVEETVKFFNDSMCTFPAERKKMMQKLYLLVGEDYLTIASKVHEYAQSCPLIKKSGGDSKPHTEL